MQINDTADSTRLTLTDYMRKRFSWVLKPIVVFIDRLGITPNMLTFIGLVGNLVGAVFLSQGYFLVGGLIILCMGPLDALDGALARLHEEPTHYGAFVDSVTDRYSELFIFAGLLFHYLKVEDWLWAGMVYAAAAGSVLVSYTRARAESVGYQAKGGIFTRAERFAVLIPSLIFSYPHIGIALIALFANFTALQRIFDVRRQARG